MSAPDDPTEPRLYTVEEVARLLRMSRAFVYRLVMSGQLESVLLGRSRRVPSIALDSFIDRLRRDGGIS